jgi:hypothetical protein
LPGGSSAKGTRTRPTALAEDDSNIHIKIDVRNGQTRRLGHTHARVQEQADDGSVTAIVETRPFMAARRALIDRSSSIGTGASGMDGGRRPVMGEVGRSSSSTAQR